MIRVLDDMPDGVLGFEATGKLTADDYTKVLAPALAAAAAGGAKIRVVLDFTGEFDGMEAGAVWQDLKTGIQDWHAWDRIALVHRPPLDARRAEHVRLGRAGGREVVHRRRARHGHHVGGGRLSRRSCGRASQRRREMAQRADLATARAGLTACWLSTTVGAASRSR